jgi:hypothetical protein
MLMPISPRARPDLNPVNWYAAQDPGERSALLHMEKLRRCVILHTAEHDLKFQAALMDRSKRDLAFWFDNFAVTYDPRDHSHYPMVLWPVQRRYLAFVLGCIEKQTDWLCAKSRDMGVTYLNCGLAVHHWLFVYGFKTGFCANKLDLVDELGNPDTIFEKMRMIIDALPWWMKPQGYNRGTCALSSRIVNPDNANTIIGEGGSNAGRGGRNSLYVVDEAAHVENAQGVNAATSANTRCRGWVSSANGMGNFFYERHESGEIPVITVHWRDHPFRDEDWAAREKRRITKVTFASEHDIDFSASLSGMVIEKQWVDAAVELWKLLPHPSHGPATAGLDVGAGKDLSVFQPRRGELVLKALSREDPDTTDTANWALDLCGQYGIRLLTYDSVGVGEGVKSTLKRGWHEIRGFRIQACAWGLPPTGSRRWEDGRSSKERFRDIKAEVWWIMRERFRNSYEHHEFLLSHEGGIKHDQCECILLEPSIELQRQLVTVRYETSAVGSKIQIESKLQLRARGVKSPDYADALAYSFWEPVLIDLGRDLVIGDPRDSDKMGF